MLSSRTAVRVGEDERVICGFEYPYSFVKMIGIEAYVLFRNRKHQKDG
jgi:hypothetical protein